MIKIENNLKTNINWFPGHMAKTKKEIKESLKNIDLVAEILDSRIPFSSSNPEIDEIIGEKPRIVVLNKSDLSDENLNKKWINFYKTQNINCICFSNKDNLGKSIFTQRVFEIMKPKIDSWRSKGIINRAIRVMVIGIPNVGKSSFINKLCKNSKAKVENRPGVTRRNQWFSVDKNILILDTPGVLWPKFDTSEVAHNLAFTGAIKDEILDIESIVPYFIDKIKNSYISNLTGRFKIDIEYIADLSSNEILEKIAQKRGMLVSGGEVDFLRASNMILEEFRNGKLGKITLENPKIQGEL